MGGLYILVMLTNPKILELIGRYGGPTAVVLWVVALFNYLLVKLPGDPQAKEKRIARSAIGLFVLGGIALLTQMKLPKTVKTTVQITPSNNMSCGALSPNAPNNSGNISISGTVGNEK
ncbi:hypothetical protein ACFQBQ_11495 [Granulicella cerasi]|uniref:Uncharacterized protein n=1 Tax=Granulicella cerasi TaxID=741063 RepID=A0ABW1ZAR1_9BACT|nr:hypothetical protein [Granulicella cerasi]